MRFSLFSPFLALMLFVPTSFGSSYLVKKDENLSDIIHQSVPGPVWGKGGTLNRTLKLNPWIKNPNHLLPGQVVTLPLKLPLTPPIVHLEKNALSQTSFFFLTPYTELNSLEVVEIETGNRAVVSCSSHFGIEAKYLHSWSSESRSHLRLKAGRISFDPVLTNGTPLPVITKFLYGFEIGNTWQLSKPISFTLSAAEEQKLFIHDLSSTDFRIDTLWTPVAGSKFSFDIIPFSTRAIGVSAEAAINLKSSNNGTESKLGQTYGTSVFLHPTVFSDAPSQIHAELGFKTRLQDTSLTKQTENTFFLKVGLFF